MKNKFNSFSILLFIIIIILMGYITYSELNKVKIVPKPKEEQIVNEDSYNDYYELLENYYSEIVYKLGPYELKYKGYKVKIGSWNNIGSPITIIDKKGKEVYSFYAKSNYDMEDKTIEFLPYINSDGKLYFVSESCNTQGTYLSYIDLNDSKFKIVNEKDLSDYNLVPHGEMLECEKVD